MFEHLNTLIDTLSHDHRRGAAEIVEDAAGLFIDIARHGSQNPTGAEQLFSSAVRRLARGQPTMAPVLNLLNRTCLARERAWDDWEAFTGNLTAYRDERRSQLDIMVEHAAELPCVEGTLLTFSNSSTVVRLVTACRELGWPERVICGEGRPVMEGLVMAHKLTAADVPVTLYTDAALMSRIVECDGVWVGGDSLSRQGLVNKVGSRALAMLARAGEMPFISLMASDKLLPHSMIPFFKFLPQNPHEIASDEADELEVVNEYYETIPNELVSYIFTEQGLAQPEVLVDAIQHEPVSALFSQLVRD